tara:strand:+ start:1785 stop:2984 length:1200 start_codon:yes stop_codon:yes gene_type:complete
MLDVEARQDISTSSTVKWESLMRIGSHNSIMRPMPSSIFNTAVFLDSSMKAFVTNHGPLKQQLDNGIRSLEIDMHYDPTGSSYTYSPFLEIAAPFLKLPSSNPIDVLLPLGYSNVQSLNESGIKTFHTQLDPTSYNFTLKENLRELKSWLIEHPWTSTVFVTLQLGSSANTETIDTALINLLKQDRYDEIIRSGWRFEHEWPAIAASGLEEEILETLGEDLLVKPSYVQSTYNSVRERVKHIGWPSTNDTLGKVVIILDCNASLQEEYMRHEQRLAFTMGRDADNVDLDPIVSIRNASRFATDRRAGISDENQLLRVWLNECKHEVSEPGCYPSSDLLAHVINSEANLVVSDFAPGSMTPRDENYTEYSTKFTTDPYTIQNIHSTFTECLDYIVHNITT